MEGEARGSNRSKGTERRRYANTQHPVHRWGLSNWWALTVVLKWGCNVKGALEGPGGGARVGEQTS